MHSTTPISSLLKGWEKDPTVLFTFLVMIIPSIFCPDLISVIRYLTTPMLVLALIFMFLVLKVTAQGKCVELNDRDRRVAFWFLMNGVFYNLFLDVVSGQFQMMDEMSRQYLKVDPRYAIGHLKVEGQSVFWTSMCEIFFQSPFCLLCFYGYHRNRPWRRPLEIIVSILQVAGVWWFYLPEAFSGFQQLGGHPPNKFGGIFSMHNLLFHWFGFWFMGTLWVTVGISITWTAFWDLAEIVSKSG
jgi:hypothetical protein